MISASKSTLSLNNLKILRPRVTNNLMTLLKKFCKFPPRDKRINLSQKYEQYNRDENFHPRVNIYNKFLS